MESKNCLHCNKIFQDYPCRINTRIYCSASCSTIAFNKRTKTGKSQPQLNNFQFKKNQTPWNKGVRGKDSYAYGRKHNQDTKDKLSNMRLGENNPAWKGGVSFEMAKLRTTHMYKDWAVTILERDNYTCQFCDYQSEERSDFHADHIKSFTKYPELRLDLDNGRTLCISCHLSLTALQNKQRSPKSLTYKKV